MNKYCPNKNLPEWKELVEVVGENKAYYLWDQNKGNGLDKASNGEDSKLFSDLLNKFDGDRKQAILAKAETFTNAFKTQLSEELSKQVDNNGELLIEAYNKRYDTISFTSSDNSFTLIVILSSSNFGLISTSTFTLSSTFLFLYYSIDW